MPHVGHSRQLDLDTPPPRAEWRARAKLVQPHTVRADVRQTSATPALRRQSRLPAGPPCLRRGRETVCRSSSRIMNVSASNGCDPSRTSRVTAAPPTARSARRTPRPPPRHQAGEGCVSTGTGTPPRSTASTRRSRVVPGVAATIARSSPPAGNKLDFPALTAPRSRTGTPPDHPPWSAARAGRNPTARRRFAPYLLRIDEVVPSSGKSSEASSRAVRSSSVSLSRRWRSRASLPAGRTQSVPATESPPPPGRDGFRLRHSSRRVRNARNVNSPGAASRAP